MKVCHRYETGYGLVVNEDGYAVVQWHDEEGELVTAELDPNSKDVKEALGLIRKIIWGEGE